MFNQHFTLGGFKRYGNRLLARKVGEAAIMNKFQADAWQHRDEKYLLINAPCGSGKTLMQIWFSIHDIVSSGFTRRQLILVPQIAIGNEFRSALVNYEGRPVTWKVDALDNNQSELDELRRFLLRPPLTKIYSQQKDTITGLCRVATHQAFGQVWMKLTKAEQRIALTNITLRIDEAHHIKHAYASEDIDETSEEAALHLAATRLGHACKLAMESDLGTKLHMTTATFFRGDRSVIFTETFMKQLVTYTLSWIAHWEETGIKNVKILYEKCTRHDILNRMLDNIIAEPDRHHLIFLPAMGRGMRTNDTIGYIIKRLAPKFGDKLLDLTTRSTQNANRKNLNQETKVVISCALFNEGTNWKPCDRIHNLDCERSAMLAVQRIGRGLRAYPNKDELYVTYYYELDPAMKPREKFSNHTTSIAIAMTLTDLFSPIMLNVVNRRIGSGTRNKKVTLCELLGDKRTMIYEALHRILVMADRATIASSMIEQLVEDEFEDYAETDQRAIVDGLKRKVVQLVSRSSDKPDAPVDKIRQSWDKVWEKKDGSVWEGLLTIDDLKTLRAMLRTNSDEFIERFAEIEAAGGVHVVEKYDPKHHDYDLKRWMVKHLRIPAIRSHFS